MSLEINRTITHTDPAGDEMLARWGGVDEGADLVISDTYFSFAEWEAFTAAISRELVPDEI